ncbi:marine proteobacterial sortase target protein [Marinobacter sp. CHS3-4]|uniref:marine proteobacterial sortase target protein n=1 Tax=Marinobacter sp. CHS3-4 TaxID=3045174 RepID=UPI0024B505C4|nr:marine proteobacterial sortase target protein [Marinobacter sp. CHS3-4]MDI9244009.1 marine proteobacterial sortase target protein [Marinobacter sp. CHS3-4]
MLRTYSLSMPAHRQSKRTTLLDRRRVRRIMEGVSLWLAMLLLLFVQPIFAEANEREQGVGQLRFVDNQGRATESATLINTDYQVDVTGLIADVHLKQTFRNPSQNWREAVFVFPLSEGASVYGLTMTAGERRIVGEIREKAVAKKEYAKAKSEGRKAARVEQQRPNLFTTHLANIPPGEAIVVELDYQQAVRYQSGLFELRLPTTMTPRYMPGKPLNQNPFAGPRQWQGGWATPTGEVPDADKISPFTVRRSDLQPDSHNATVVMNINAGLPVSRVSSPSHKLNSTWNGHSVEVTPEQTTIPMDRDMVVRWAPARGMAPSAAVFQEQWQGEDYLMAMMIPGLESEQRIARELVFVIDTSGSMAGESIRQARQSLMRGLGTLGPDDTFNVIQFNSQTASLFMGSVPANGNNLARAHRYVRNLTADGGTEMAPALDAALQDHRVETVAGNQRLRQVVFITDGSVGNEAALFRQIRQQLGDTRLFTVGIGSAPNMHFMREAARYGRGTYTAISSTSDVKRPLDELFGKMESPVLTDIQVDWPQSGANQNAQPRRIGDLFLGEPMVQVVRGHQPNGRLTMSGRLPDGSQWTETLNLENAALGSGLHRVWAREQIDGLLAARTLGQSKGEESETTVQAQVTALGLEHQLITPYTSFLAVDKTPARPAESALTSDSVPTLLPAGSSAGMLRYPQTATWAPLMQALGLLGLMISGAIGLLRRRVFV